MSKEMETQDPQQMSFDDWELVDMSPKKEPTPKMSSPSIINLDNMVGSELQCENENEKRIKEKEAVDDMTAQWRQQEERLQKEQMKYRQLSKQIEKSTSVSESNLATDCNPQKTKSLTAVDKSTDLRICADNQKELEKQKKESQQIIEELLRANEEMRKKIEEERKEREKEKKKEIEREEEYLQEIERTKYRQLQTEMEKEAIEKEREQIQKEKQQFEKEKEALLLLQQQQQQQRPQKKCNADIDTDKYNFDMDISFENENENEDENEKSNVCGCNLDKSTLDCQRCSSPQIEFLALEKTSYHYTCYPCEEKQLQWVLHNYSDLPLTMNVKLERIGNENDVVICEENTFATYKADANSTMNIVVHGRAPSICGKYNVGWQMVTPNNKHVGPRLEMQLTVVSDLKPSQEQLVRQILDMGFKDRSLVVAALSANEWDLETSLQTLAEQ